MSVRRRLLEIIMMFKGGSSAVCLLSCNKVVAQKVAGHDATKSRKGRCLYYIPSRGLRLSSARDFIRGPDVHVVVIAAGAFGAAEADFLGRTESEALGFAEGLGAVEIVARAISVGTERRVSRLDGAAAADAGGGVRFGHDEDVVEAGVAQKRALESVKFREAVDDERAGEIRRGRW